MKLSTGKLNYHLKILEPLIEKEGEYYKLNEKGEQLVSIMLSLEGDKDETQYNKVLPQYLALLGVVIFLLTRTLHVSFTYILLKNVSRNSYQVFWPQLLISIKIRFLF